MDRIAVIRNHCFGEYLNIGAATPSTLGKLWYPLVEDLEFVPEFMIVRSVAVSQTVAPAAATSIIGTALMFSDGTSSLQAIAILSGGTPGQVCAAGESTVGNITCPQIVIALRKPVNQCRFQCYSYTATASTLGPGIGSGLGAPAAATYKPYVSVIVNFVSMIPGIPRGMPRLSLDWVERTYSAFLLGGTGQAVQGDFSQMVTGLAAVRPDFLINHGAALSNSFNANVSPNILVNYFILDGRMQPVYDVLSLGNAGTNAGTAGNWGFQSASQTVFKIQDPQRMRSQVNFKHVTTVSVLNADDTFNWAGTNIGDHGSLISFVQLKSPQL